MSEYDDTTIGAAVYARLWAMMDACNVSAVIHEYTVFMEHVNEDMRRTGKGEDWRRRHPITIIILDKIAQLASMSWDQESQGVVLDAYAFVYKHSK